MRVKDCYSRKASKVRTLSVRPPFFSPKNSSFIVALVCICGALDLGGGLELFVVRNREEARLRMGSLGGAAVTARLQLALAVPC